jgi:hypothetical protein
MTPHIARNSSADSAPFTAIWLAAGDTDGPQDITTLWGMEFEK